MRTPQSSKRVIRILSCIALIGLIAAAIGMSVAAFGHPAQVQAQDRGNPDFWFLNQTGSQIDRIYVSPHGNPKWGDDLLGDQATLASGIGLLITFPEHSPCELDFKLVYHDGTVDTYQDGFNTCNLHAVIFTPGEAHGY